MLGLLKVRWQVSLLLCRRSRVVLFGGLGEFSQVLGRPNHSLLFHAKCWLALLLLPLRCCCWVHESRVRVILEICPGFRRMSFELWRGLQARRTRLVPVAPRLETAIKRLRVGNNRFDD